MAGPVKWRDQLNGGLKIMNCDLRPRRRHAGPRMECKNRAICFLAHWVKIWPGILHIKLQMNVKLWNHHIVHLKKVKITLKYWKVGEECIQEFWGHFHQNAGSFNTFEVKYHPRILQNGFWKICKGEFKQNLHNAGKFYWKATGWKIFF